MKVLPVVYSGANCNVLSRCVSHQIRLQTYYSEQ